MRWVGIFLQGGTFRQRTKFIKEIQTWYKEHDMRCMCFVHGAIQHHATIITSPLRKQLAECMIYELEFKHPVRDNRSRILAYKLPEYGYKTIVVTIEPNEPNMTTYADHRITIHPEDNLIPILLEVTGGLNADSGISRRYAKNLRGKPQSIVNTRGRKIANRTDDKGDGDWDEFGSVEENNLLS